MAERDITASVQTALTAAPVRPVYFFQGEYDASGTPAYLRLWTGYGDLSWDGQTWTGGRNLLDITPLREGANLEAIGFSVVISGMPSDKLSIALQSLRKNRPGKLWLGFLDSSLALIDAPIPLRRGRFDVAPIARQGGSMTIELRYTSRLGDLERPRERHYTDADQQKTHPGDSGFRHVPALQDAQIPWDRGLK